MSLTRPMMRYHGGKWRIAPWVIQHLPPHRIYVEPFGGAASVLLRKARSYAEVYNDLDEGVVNVFRVMRDPSTAEQLRRAIELTPWSRVEFNRAYEDTDDPVEWARRTIVKSFMAHGSTWQKRNRTGFRSKNYRRKQPAGSDWRSWPNCIPAFVSRLRGVTIECRPALELIEHQDTPETVFYIDPPYVLSTRSSVRTPSDAERAYRHDLTEGDHRELAEVLASIHGTAIVSGYRSPLYDELYEGWRRVDRTTSVDAGQERVESLWIHPRAEAAALRLGLEVSHAS